MSFLRGFLTSPSEEQNQHGGVETIEKLCDRLETATLLDDRRDAIRALRALSKSYQVEVGTHAMDMLIKVLLEDSSDVEVTEMIIETLLNVMATSGEVPVDTEIGVQFTEIFVKSEANITLLLSLLEEYDFHIRWPTVKLLILLLKNRSKDLQDKVLESPMGISKLMDLLSDSREIIRNDGLLLMIKLTKNNPAIQKIVAFENAFERLLMIVSGEGYSDGGIVVEDCLNLLLNLLKNNLSNQNFFRETSNIQRIAPFFEIDSDEEEEETTNNMSPVWNMQKQTNVLLMLDVVQVLISPTNNQQSVISCQKVIYTRGIYMQLMDLLLYPNLPPDIFAKLLVTIGDTIRGNEIIQQFMDELELSDRKAVVLILMFMVNDKQPFKTRLAALYCVQCFLFKNGKGQASVISTLLPNQEDVPTGVTSGQLLCAGLFSCDDVAHWLCSVTLAHCLYNNVTQHDNLLHVQLELTPGLPPVYLISQVFNMLVKEENHRTTFGTLMLMCHWVEDCPEAVNKLLQTPHFVPYLLEQIESNDGESAMKKLESSICALLLGLCLKYNDNTSPQYAKTSLLHLVTHRIGTDNYTEILESTNVSSHFTQASKSAHPTATVPLDMVLDYSFTKFYKKQQDLVVKALDGEEEVEPGNTIETHDLIVNSYKDLIKQQDEEIHKLRSELEEIRAGSSAQEAAISQPHATDSQLAESQALVAQYAEQNAQLQQYINDQDTRYKQYIAELQTWYNDQLAQANTNQLVETDEGEVPTVTATAEGTQSEVVSGGAADEELQNKYDTLRHEKQTQDQYMSELVRQIEELKIDLEKSATTALTEESTVVPPVPNTDTVTLTQSSLHQDQLLADLALRDALYQQLEVELTVLKSKLTESETENGSRVSYLESKLAEKETESETRSKDLARLRSDNEILSERLREVVCVSELTQSQVAGEHDSKPGLGEKIANLEIEIKRLETDNAKYAEQIAATNSTEQSETVVEQTSEEEETQGYMYDYSQWFTPLVADDGITYYQSTDGHIYTEEQYKYTIDQYEVYYRQQNAAQDQHNADQQSAVQDQQQVDTHQQTEIQPQTDTQQQTDTQEQTTTQQQTELLQQSHSQQQTEAQKQTNSQQQTEAQKQTNSQQQTEQQVASQDEMPVLRAELERARKEIEHLAGVISSFKNEKSDRVKQLSQSAISNHVIEVNKTPCQKTDVKLISIESAGHPTPNSPTPEMDSVSSAVSEHNELVLELQALQEKFDNLSTEQDDLLVLLAHQDKQLANLKARLRDHGDSITLSDSDDDFDDLLDSVENLPNTSELTGDGRLAL